MFMTASAVATACGANPYEKRSVLIKRKTGRAPAFLGNIATSHGTKYEPEAIRKYEQTSGEKVLSFGLLQSMNTGEEFVAGSPDGITATGRLIEVKCPFKRKPTDIVPAHYVYQIQTLMHILRLPVCDFVQYVPETVWSEEIFIITVVPYDPYFWACILPKIQRVWTEIMDIRAGRIASDESGSSSEGETKPVVKRGKTIKIPQQAVCNIDLVPRLEHHLEQPEVTVTDADGIDERWKGISSFFTTLITK